MGIRISIPAAAEPIPELKVVLSNGHVVGTIFMLVCKECRPVVWERGWEYRCREAIYCGEYGSWESVGKHVSAWVHDLKPDTEYEFEVRYANND